MDKKILLSGIKPTGRLHVGNYFGAIKQFVELQDGYQSFFMVANLHALTSVHSKEELKELSMEVVKDYLAVGLDPRKSTIFLQSDVHGHTELAWIFSTLTSMPYLKRAHAFKDAEAKNEEINVGTFNYPMLMAADILLYDTDVVPVGKDQAQHVEITRDTAQKFNNTYGELFKLPKALILKEVETVPGIDGQKMSKSYNNTIPLFGSDEEIRGQVAKIVTDSKDVGEVKNPEEDNVFALHKLFSKEELPLLEKRYKSGEIGYQESKEILSDNIIKMIAPMREKREKITDEEINRVLNEGGKKALKIVLPKLLEIRKITGLL